MVSRLWNKEVVASFGSMIFTTVFKEGVVDMFYLINLVLFKPLRIKLG